MQILSAKSTESLSNISQGSVGTKSAVNQDSPSSSGVGQGNNLLKYK